MNESSFAAQAVLAVLWGQATEPDDDLEDEAEPLEDDVYPGNDEYEDVPEEDEA